MPSSSESAPHDLAGLRAAAITAARAAGALIREGARRGFQRRHKGEVDLVTEVDLASEAEIRRLLAPLGIPVQGEEGGGDALPTRWVVDPLDGTTNFVHGFPYYAVSIGLVVDGVPSVGVVLDVPRDVCFSAHLGGGATADDARIAVSEVDTLNDALLGTGFPYDRRARIDFYLDNVRKALMHGQGLRRGGAAALDLAMVAAGHLDAYWEHHLAPWDVAAGVVLVREAGGIVTDADGGAFVLDRPNPLATNARLHGVMVDLLAGRLDRV